MVLRPEDETVETYSFKPADLMAENRPAGISAFLRVKNGEDFLEATIRSHIDLVDEIVAVHHQCTDATVGILARLQSEYGRERLTVVAYLPEIFAPGSPGYASEPATSPRSYVNLSNLALVRTRYRIAVKLDDDHVAIPERFAAAVQSIKSAGYRLPTTVVVSGINLARDEDGRTGILAREPFTGAGDRSFFEVRPGSYFVHDRRFERMTPLGRRVFGDVVCWHLKYMKQGFGFANRRIDLGNPRYARRRAEFLANRRVLTLDEFVAAAPRGLRNALSSLVPGKPRLRADRWRRVTDNPPTEADLRACLAMIERYAPHPAVAIGS